MNDGTRTTITGSETDSLLITAIAVATVSVFLSLSSEPQLPHAVTRITGEV